MAQGFRFVMNDYGAPERRVSSHFFTDNEAGSAGQAVKLVDGRWTGASGTDAIGGFLTHNVSAGTDQVCEVILAREGDWFDVPYSGEPGTGFGPGANEVGISADGLSADAATVEGGALSVLEVNTEKQTCRVKVKNRQFG